MRRLFAELALHSLHAHFQAQPWQPIYQVSYRSFLTPHNLAEKARQEASRSCCCVQQSEGLDSGVVRQANRDPAALVYHIRLTFGGTVSPKALTHPVTIAHRRADYSTPKL